jgi:hypothetical protein
LRTATPRTLLSVHLEIPCPSAGSGLSAYLESDLSVNTAQPGSRRPDDEAFLRVAGLRAGVSR